MHKTVPFLLLCNIFSELKELHIYVIFPQGACSFLSWTWFELPSLDGTGRIEHLFIIMVHTQCQSMPSIYTHQHTHSVSILCIKWIKWFHDIKGRYWDIGTKHFFSERGNNMYIPFFCAISEFMYNYHMYVLLLYKGPDLTNVIEQGVVSWKVRQRYKQTPMPLASCFSILFGTGIIKSLETPKGNEPCLWIIISSP